MLIIKSLSQGKSSLHIIGLIALFFISGFSALCYQLVWQRILFATFGINIESVTIIVSLFMFGLGAGSMLGAKLQQYRHHLLRMFIACEVGIAMYGMISQQLIRWLGSFQAVDSLFSIAVCVYIMLAIPTLLMGATLPLLVGFINRYIGNTGKTIGWLYASNTFGAVAAAYMIVKVIFVHWGLSATVNLAVSLNLITAALSYLLYRNLKIQENAEEPAPQTEEATGMMAFTPKMLMLLAFMIGYISLSQELIWYRLLGFLTSNRPEVFGMLLAVFLAGIALASLIASKICKTPKHIFTYITITMLLMQLVWYATFPYLAHVTAHDGRDSGLKVGLWLTGLTAFLSGAIFPMLCHVLQMRTRETAGRVVGKIYFANVMGSTIGPLLTGFLFFEYMSIQTVIYFTGVVTAFVLLAMLSGSEAKKSFKRHIIFACLIITAIGYNFHQRYYRTFLEKLQYAELHEPFDYMNTNRSGVISVVDGSVYGNGAYDGKINTDPGNDNNGIWRAYAISVMHPNPKRILQIGMSSGSWSNVFSFYQPLDEVIVVEINKGYLEMIANYKSESGVLTHPKVNIVIDDGRHWVLNHPDEKFDLIVMNTIYYWRSNSTNLLSREFLEICKQHLNPGGLVYVNNTGAEDVNYTMAKVFPYVSAFSSTMVIGGDKKASRPVPMETKIEHLRAFVNNNGELPYRDRALMMDMANMTFPNQRQEILSKNGLFTITDDNMAGEFKKK